MKMNGLLAADDTKHNGDSNTHFSTAFADISDIRADITTKTFCKRTETINLEAQEEYSHKVFSNPRSNAAVTV